MARLLIFLVMGFVFVVSCGAKDKEFSGSLGICSRAYSDLNFTLCGQYSYTMKGKKDKGDDAAAEVERECASESGVKATYDRTGTCKGKKGIGTCAFSATNSSATVSVEAFFSGDGITVNDAKSACKENSGTYSAFAVKILGLITDRFEAGE